MSSRHTVEGPAATGADVAGAGTANGTWPWQTDQVVAARLCVASLTSFFVKNLGRDGRLQLETVFTTLGALTGFAAHYAVRQTSAASPMAKADDVFTTVVGPAGERYFLSEQVNALLMPLRIESLSVWTLIAATALQGGVERQDLPDCWAIIERVARSIGTPEFGMPQTPAGLRPWLKPRRAVEIFWPAVLRGFTREPVVPVPGFTLIEPALWPRVLAVVAAGYLQQSKAAMPPSIAVALYMEAAIAMAKIDQSAVVFVGGTRH